MRAVRTGRVWRVLVVTAGAILVAYLMLALLATVCMTVHGRHHAGSHDHSQQPIHSLLCIWACQAGAPDCLSVASSLPPTMFLILAVVILPFAILLQPAFQQAFPRAPPR